MAIFWGYHIYIVVYSSLSTLERFTFPRLFSFILIGFFKSTYKEGLVIHVKGLDELGAGYGWGNRVTRLEGCSGVACNWLIASTSNGL